MTDSGDDALNRVITHDYPGSSFELVEGSRWGELIVPTGGSAAGRSPADLRVVAMTSFLYSREVIGSLVDFEGAALVGLSTDDASNAEAKIGIRKRFWKDYTPDERLAIEAETVECAIAAGVPIYTGEIKTTGFYGLLERWQPDVIIVCAYGQILNARILDMPRYGAYNFHPADLTTGHGAGPQPYEDFATHGGGSTRWTVHQMTVVVDEGPIVGVSPRIHIADAAGDPKRFYDGMTEVVRSMVPVLMGAIAAHSRVQASGSIDRVDFGDGDLDRP